MRVPHFALTITALLVCLPAWPGSASNAWFGGGIYDGYDNVRAQGALDYPQVNNAAGATNITASSAWLNGMLLATGGAPASVYVFWGETDGVTNRSAWTHTNSLGQPAELEALTVNVAVNSNSVYYYRFYATNTAGDEGWADASSVFAVPGPPSVNSGPGVLPLGRTTATLNGVLAAGGNALVTFYWGPNSNAWANTNSIGSRNEGPLRAMIGGLSPGAPYFYQVYATNSYGDGKSAIVSFTTAASAAWSGGGAYDGYDQLSIQSQLPGSQRGTMISIR